MAEAGPPKPEVPPAPPTLPWFTSVSWPPLHHQIYERVYGLILERGLFFNSETAREQPPYKFKTPEELRQEIDFTLGEKGVDDNKMMEYFEKLIEYSPHRSHPFFLSKDGSSLDPHAIAGDFIGSILSTAVLTYLFAPVFTLQEFEMEQSLRKLIGYKHPEDGDGVQVPGGGYATAMVIATALNYRYPDIRDRGFGIINEPSLAVYASENCNEFVEKSCISAGLGSESLVKIRADTLGRMNFANLRQQVQKNKSKDIEPLMVIATVGTDPLGAIDPIQEIAQFCQEEGIWLHIDGVYGGPLILSDQFRQGKLAGIEKSQSFAFGGSGMLGTPYCYTTVVTPFPEQFFRTFGVGAEVVFEPTLLYDSTYDKGDHTIQTSRRGDITKFWLMWQAKGRNGLSQHIHHIMDLATQFNDEIKRRSSFHAIMHDIDSTRVAFYYIPNKYRYMPRRYDYMNLTMSTMSRKIKNNLLGKGSVFLSLGKARGYPECFVVSISQSTLTIEDLKYVLDEIEASGKESVKRMSKYPNLPVGPNPIPLDPEESSVSNSSENDNNVNHADSKLSAPLPTFASPPPPKSTYPSYVNTPLESQHRRMFQRIMELFDKRGMYFQEKREQPLICFRDPDQLHKEFDLKLSDQPKLKTEDDVIKALTNMIRYSIHQAHPFYIYQLLSGGLDAYTIMSDFLISLMSSSCLTYEDAPFYTLMEEEVLRASRKRFGFPEDGDGMLCAGGTHANINTMVIARLALFPETKEKGLDGWRQLKFTAFISQNSHYCFQKGALLQGIGLDNVVKVNVTSDGRMDPNALRKAIAKTKAEGGTPFYVVATAGTTVLGVFDPFTEIAQVCQENNVWMHIDGSPGGAAMFSDFHLKDKLNGAQMADSINYNPHKWFGATQEVSILMFKQNGIVKRTLGSSSSQRESSRVKPWFGIGGGGSNDDPSTRDQSRNYDSVSAYGDLAAHSGIGWDRRANIFKFWILWKRKGLEGLRQHIDYTYANQAFMVNELKRPERQEMFRLVKPSYQLPGVCFYYLPLALRGMDENSEEYKYGLERVPLPLQARLVRADVTVTPVFRDNGSPLFTKFTIMSSGINTDDILYLLDAIDYYGRDLPIQ